MAKALHAVNYLAQAEKYPPRPVCVVFGNDAFLRRQSLLKLREAVLGGDEADFSLTAFEGRTAELRDVLEELATVAMFGGKRLVVVEEADEFISRYRADLEDYVARPSRTGVLVLEAATWPSNTRLYKAVAAEGLAIDCNVPAAAQLARWLGGWAKQTHGVELPLAAAEMLVEIIGPELGLIDQELAKMALMAGSERKITPGAWSAAWSAAGGPRPPGRCSTPPWTASRRRPCCNSTGCWRPAKIPSACWRRFPPRSAAWPPPRD